VNRKNLSALVVGVLLVVGLLPLAGCHKNGTASTSGATALTAKMQPPKVGQAVAIPWSNQAYYLAKVTKVDGDQITAQFADGMNSATVAAADVRLIPVKNWAIGDKVMAAGPSGEFGAATIVTADSDLGNYVVKFDDTSVQNASVTADKIMAR
jgi:hypothetical protein